MAVKNNDDVAHLLEAAGRSGAPYREFESPSDHMSAPLIDAVFAKGPPDPTPEMQRLGPIQTGPSSSDILSEVFEGGPRGAPAGAVSAPPNTSPALGYPQAPAQPPLIPGQRQGMGAKRSLGDIRRIITKRAEEVPGAQASGDLNGLFDRLAG
jgi:hypothetical protein